MRVAVIGAGIVGAATALALQEVGHKVVVLEREGKAGMGTSFANGGQLSFGHAQPWANPSVFGQLPRWLFSNRSPIKFKTFNNVQALRWAWQFLRASAPKASQKHASALLTLAMQSRDYYGDWLARYGWQDVQTQCGTLHLFGHAHALKSATEHASWQARRGCNFDLLHPREVVLKEPSLAHRQATLAGALLFPDDGCGDAHKLCHAMLAQAVELGAQLHVGAQLQRIEREGKRLRVVSEAYSQRVDAVVMCCGVAAQDWAERLRVKLPLMPLQGYSLTFNVSDEQAHQFPQHAITDISAKMVMSRLGTQLRVAGFGDMGVDGVQQHAKRQKQLQDYAAAWFPVLQGAEPCHQWVGQRPALPHAVPVAQETGMAGVWLNVGHGSLGWTLAAGSAARMVAQLGNPNQERAVQERWSREGGAFLEV